MATKKQKIKDALSKLQKGTDASKKGQKFFKGGRLTNEELAFYVDSLNTIIKQLCDYCVMDELPRHKHSAEDLEIELPEIELPDIDHNALTNYVSEEHVDWAASGGPMHLSRLPNHSHEHIVAVTGINIFRGVATSNQNVHGAKGTKKNITWDTSVNDTEEIDAHNDGEHEVNFLSSGMVNIHATVDLLDSGINNRNTYLIRIRHFDFEDALKYDYEFSGQYIRDDADTYDSGFLVARLGGHIVDAGDYIIVQTEVIDAQTTTGTLNAGTLSKINIDKVIFT